MVNNSKKIRKVVLNILRTPLKLKPITVKTLMMKS